MLGSRWTARLVLAAGVLLGLGSGIDMLVRTPEQVGLASDVYVAAGRAVLEGSGIYEAAPPDHPGYRYLYPPIVVLVFLPHAVLGATGALAIQTILNAAAGLTTALVVWRALERRGVDVTGRDFALLAGTVLVSTYGIGHLLNGQTTTWVGFAFAVGFDALDRRRGRLAGVAFAGAALLKVFPAAVGLWMLRDRAWRATGVALGVGSVGLVAGLGLGVETTATYVQEVLLGRFEERSFEGSPTVADSAGGAQRQIAAVSGLGSPATAIVALAVLAPILSVVYANVDLDVDHQRQAAALATIAVTLLALPLQPRYGLLLVYPLVVLLYTCPPGRARTIVLIGAVVSFVRLEYEAVRLVTGAVDAWLLKAVDEALRIGLTIVQPPTLGLWLLLAGSVVLVRE